MELTQLNNLGFSDVGQSGIGQVQAKKSVEVDSDNKPLKKVDQIELQNQTQSSFASSIMNNIKQISNTRNLQNTVSKQLEIVNQIEQSISSVVSGTSSKQSLDDIQPQIKNLMDNFNNYSNTISTSDNTVSIDLSDEKSRVYFDGILGAKPLSSEEILAEVQIQRERLQNINKTANNEVLNNIQKSKDMFNTQKQELEIKQPQIKNVNFSVESSNFESKTLQNMDGSLINIQANAQVEHSIKLLAP